MFELLLRVSLLFSLLIAWFFSQNFLVKFVVKNHCLWHGNDEQMMNTLYNNAVFRNFFLNGSSFEILNFVRDINAVAL